MRKRRKLYTEVEKAVSASGVSAELTKVEKIEEIMKLGVAFTPALVINGKVKSAGKVPSATEIASLIEEEGKSD